MHHGEDSFDRCRDGINGSSLPVNFDDPGTYHLYYGDEAGRPGTIMTYFPFPGAARGRSGAGMAVETAYAVMPGAVSFWVDRFSDLGWDFDLPASRFGARVFSFSDPHGLELALVEDASLSDPVPSATADVADATPAAATKPDSSPEWRAATGTASTGADIPGGYSIMGFHSVTLASMRPVETRRLLTQVFGYHETGKEAGRTRFESPSTRPGRVIDLVPSDERGRPGAGTIHHIAFRAASEAVQLEWKSRLEEAGMQVTPVQDRQYFKSIYFREPGGVLFEIATDGPGFLVDEPLERLGSGLMLPPWLEPRRPSIEARLEEI